MKKIVRIFSPYRLIGQVLVNGTRNRNMISCKQASRLASEQLERNLSLWERAQFRLHLAMCGGCRQLEKQFLFLRKSTNAWMNQKY